MLAFFELWDHWDEYYKHQINTVDVLLEEREGITWLWLVGYRATYDSRPFIDIWNKYNDGISFENLKNILDYLISATEHDPEPFTLAWQKFPQQILKLSSGRPHDIT